MTDFATDLLWEEAKAPGAAGSGPPADDSKQEPAATARAGAARRREPGRTAAAGRRQRRTWPPGGRGRARARQRTGRRRCPPARRAAAQRAEIAAAPKAPLPAQGRRASAAEKQVALIAVATEARRLPEAAKAAAARAAALAQVLASFEHDAGKADLLTLALLVEKAPAGIAEATAKTIVSAVMRAEPAQRASIAARIRAQLGARSDLRLTGCWRIVWAGCGQPRPPTHRRRLPPHRRTDPPMADPAARTNEAPASAPPAPAPQTAPPQAEPGAPGNAAFGLLADGGFVARLGAGLRLGASDLKRPDGVDLTTLPQPLPGVRLTKAKWSSRCSRLKVDAGLAMPQLDAAAASRSTWTRRQAEVLRPRRCTSGCMPALGNPEVKR